MTTAESCALLVDTLRHLSAVNREMDSWRLVALAAIHRNAELTRELEMLDERRYVCRTRTQDHRDVFLDQRDLRLEDAA